MVLDGVLRSPGEKPRNVAPGVAVLFLRAPQHLFFVVRPYLPARLSRKKRKTRPQQRVSESNEKINLSKNTENRLAYIHKTEPLKKKRLAFIHNIMLSFHTPWGSGGQGTAGEFAFRPCPKTAVHRRRPSRRRCCGSHPHPARGHPPEISRPASSPRVPKLLRPAQVATAEIEVARVVGTLAKESWNRSRGEATPEKKKYREGGGGGVALESSWYTSWCRVIRYFAYVGEGHCFFFF